MAAAGISSIIRKRSSSLVPASKVALLSGDRRISFGELDETSDRIASRLKERGFCRGDRAAIMGDNSPDWLEVFFAVAKLGGIVVPISHLLKPPEILFQLQDSGAGWAFVDEKMIEKVLPIRDEADVELVVLNGSAPDAGPDLGGLRAGGATPAITAADGPSLDDLVLLQYTSGTTGSPKAAMHTHRALLFQALHQIIDNELVQDDVYLVVPAFSWASGLHFLTLSCLYLGATAALYPIGGFDPDQLCIAIERYRVTRVVMVPTVLRRVVPSGAAQRHDLSSLKTILTGSEPVPVPLLEEFAKQLPGVGILQGYGMSEFPISITILKSADAITKVGSAGKATIMTELRVVDPEGNDQPPGEEGEILLHSPATMNGYWQRPEETAETLVDGWLHTGDLGYLDEEGFLYIVGRKKDMIISGGLNIYPAEIEKVVGVHEGVAECAVIGTPDDRFGEVGLAYVVVRPGLEVDLDELRAHLSDQLSTYKIPKHWVLRDEPLPRNPAGKVQKHLLEKVSPAA